MYVPTPPVVPVSCAVIVVPVATPVPRITVLTVTVPTLISVTVSVVPEIEPVNDNTL